MQPCFQPTQHPSTSARLQPLQVWQQPANDDTRLRGVRTCIVSPTRACSPAASAPATC